MESDSFDFSAKFYPFQRWMEREGLGRAAIRAFRHYYHELARGSTGDVPESEIEPLASLPDAEELKAFREAGRDALSRCAIIKLNGGLGTSMGLERAKSLLAARDGLTFLDILARQALSLRKATGHPVPLIFMNSFSTHEDTLNALAAYADLSVGLPLAFLQNKAPKVLKEDFSPPETGPDDPLSWAPPGHGDLYVALQTSGMLTALRGRGIRYLFVSNSDNLGATLDESILGYFSDNNLPFLMEAANRTEADKKGGHLARRKHDRQLVLRESAQTMAEDIEAFQDIRRHRYFNTNNLWIDLEALERALADEGGVLKLPLIRNEKTLDPRDPESPEVYQLETAMGSAIEVFEGAAAIRVPRSRFAPVKTTSDLLVVWSDAYTLLPDNRLVPDPRNRYGLPVVSLDPRHYRFVDQLAERFPSGAPSLTACRRLLVEGNIRFGTAVRVVDDARVTNQHAEPAVVSDRSLLTGEVRLN